MLTPAVLSEAALSPSHEVSPMQSTPMWEAKYLHFNMWIPIYLYVLKKLYILRKVIHESEALKKQNFVHFQVLDCNYKHTLFLKLMQMMPTHIV